MKKKILGLLLAMTLVLTACGGEEASEETSTSAETSTETSAESSEASGEAQVLTGESTIGGQNGDNDPLVVEVTVEGDTITDVQVVEHNETAGISDAALEQVPAAIVENNGTEGVDTVSGATNTSNAIIEAVDNALANQ